jgi:type IV secretion system protein VirD4
MSKGNEHLPYRTPDDPQGFGKFHWPTIFSGLLILCAANFVGTQYIATKLFFAKVLGTPIFGHIYRPYMWTVWFYRYHSADNAYIRSAVDGGIMVVVCASLLSVLYVFVTNFQRSKKSLHGQEDLHGSASFATKQDLEEYGTFQTTDGVYIGAYRDGNQVRYLKHNGKEHFCGIAPTRSGKGVGLVIPTLLAWDQSVIVYDIKGENWAHTAGWRSTPRKEGGLGQTCLKFAPLDTDTAHINPLDLLRFGETHEVGDARKLAEMLVDPGVKTGANDYFVKQAITLCAAFILHLAYEAKLKGYRPPTPASILDIATDADNHIKDVMEAVRTYSHRQPGVDRAFPGIRDLTLKTHPMVASTMSTMLAKGEKEFGAILGCLTDPLQVYADPLVRDAVAYSDFHLKDLVKHPISLYLVIPFSDQERLKPLVRLFFSMTVYRLTERMDFSKAKTVENKYKLLFLIDEFPSLGAMTIFESALAVMGGFGLRAYLILQDFTQLYKAYGEHETIISNCGVRTVYGPNNQKTAELISEMTGKRTIRHATVSFSGARTSSAQNQMSTSVQMVERALLTPDEVSKLKKPVMKNPGTDKETIVGHGDILVFVTGQKPIYGLQILYFLDPVFQARATIDPPSAAWHYKESTAPERPRSMTIIKHATAAAPERPPYEIPQEIEVRPKNTNPVIVAAATATEIASDTGTFEDQTYEADPEDTYEADDDDTKPSTLVSLIQSSEDEDTE